MSNIVDYIYQRIGFQSMASAAVREDPVRFYDTTTEFQIVLAKGDILKQNVDIVINLVSSDLDPTKGLWAQWNGKDQMQEECLAKAPEGLEDGEYVVTNNREVLREKYIYHWACVHNNEVNLQLYLGALSESFEIALSMDLRSIAVPVFGMDVFLNHSGSEETNEAFASQLCDTFLELSKKQQQLSTLTVVLVSCDSRRRETNKIYRAAIEQLEEKYICKQQKSKVSTELDMASQYRATAEQEPTSPAMDRDATDHTNHMDSTTPSFQSRSKNVVDDHSTENQWRDKGARPKKNFKTQANKKDGKNRNPKPQINVHIYGGDLTIQRTDAIVHPTSYTGSRIHLDDTVGKDLMKAGGRGFEAACRKTGQSVPQEVMVTVPGELPCKAVIHVNISLCAYSNDWVDRIRKCLLKAEANEFSSIAFPAMGLGADNADKARYFKDALEQFKQESPQHLDRVHIVLKAHQSVPIYQNIILGSSVDADKSGSTRLDQTAGGNNMPVFNSRNNASSSNPAASTSKIYKGVKIVVKQGDIAQENGDCIVHGVGYFSKFNKIPTYDPVGKALLKTGGHALEEACASHALVKNGHVITIGGELLCKNVLHKDIQEYQKKDRWDDFMYDCLDYADSYGIKTVSFPLICGSGRTDIVSYAKDKMKGVSRFIDSKSSSMKEIRFVIYQDQKAFDTFCDSLKYLGQTVHTFKTAPTQTKGNSSVMKTNSIQFGSVKLEVIEGDIGSNSSDMIVHGTCNSYKEISLDDPVGKALAKAGGQEFKNACAKKDIKQGKYTITTNGKLPCKQVLHLDISNLLPSDTTSWEQRFNSVLLRAENDKITSIAFPPFVTPGQTENSWRDMATLFKDVVLKFYNNRKPRHVKCIQIIIYKNRERYITFVDAIISGTSGANRANDQRRGAIKITGNRSTAQLEIVDGDLTNEKTDAIVHATNSQWTFKSSVVGKAILAKGGSKLVEDRNKARSSNDGTGQITGISNGGMLDCKFVIHLDMSCQAPIEDLIYACLVEARNNNLASVSFPALGTGKMLGVDPGEVANSFKAAIRRFYDSTEHSSLSRIRIVIFDKKMKDKFIDILEGLKT